MGSRQQIIPVVLCGGAGTRLWPLSRKDFPKQFIAVDGEKSLLDRTLERVSVLSDSVTVVTAAAHKFLAQEALNKQQDLRFCTLVLEPLAKNTAPAIAMAAAASENDNDLLLICPADHYLPDTSLFQQAVAEGVQAANEGAIVTFGISPSAPKSSYGYIKKGSPHGNNLHKVDRFIEKPSVDVAEQLLAQGNFLWNAGIFLLSKQTLFASLQQHAAEMLNTVKNAMTQGSRVVEKLQRVTVTTFSPDEAVLSNCENNSFDYAVLEKHDSVFVVPYDGLWSDVGSWNIVADMQSKDDQGNALTGCGLIKDAHNTFVHSPHRPIVALGTSDLLIIDTADALLVVPPEKAEHVKEAVTQLESKNISEARSHRKVMRPWGWYDSINKGERYQTKHIFVKPGASLSLQKHHHRAEHWIVVKGIAEVTCGNKKFLLSENQSTYIPVGEIHRLSNPGKIPLELIEVQSGTYLGEDDIVRYDDDYGRACENNSEVSTEKSLVD